MKTQLFASAVKTASVIAFASALTAAAPTAYGQVYNPGGYVDTERSGWDDGHTGQRRANQPLGVQRPSSAMRGQRSSLRMQWMRPSQHLWVQRPSQMIYRARVRAGQPVPVIPSPNQWVPDWHDETEAVVDGELWQRVDVEQPW